MTGLQLDDELDQACADGRITVDDADVVREFAEFLVKAGPPTRSTRQRPRASPAAPHQNPDRDPRRLLRQGRRLQQRLSALGAADYIERGEQLAITAAGLSALGPYTLLPRGAALVEHHKRNLPKAAKEILDVLVEHYPDALDKEEIAAATPSQYAPTGGGFNNALSRLRSLELAVTTEGLTRAADELIDDGDLQ